MQWVEEEGSSSKSSVNLLARRGVTNKISLSLSPASGILGNLARICSHLRERRLKGGRCRRDKGQICYVCPPVRAAVALCARTRQFLIPAPTLPKRTARTSRLSALVGRWLPPADLLPASASCAFVRGHAAALELAAVLAVLAVASSLCAAAEALCWVCIVCSSCFASCCDSKESKKFPVRSLISRRL